VSLVISSPPGTHDTLMPISGIALVSTSLSIGLSRSCTGHRYGHGGVDCPQELSPQHSIAPAVVIAQPNKVPADTNTNVPLGALHSPRWLSPKHAIVPDVVRPHLCVAPDEIDAQLALGLGVHSVGTPHSLPPQVTRLPSLLRPTERISPESTLTNVPGGGLDSPVAANGGGGDVRLGDGAVSHLKSRAFSSEQFVPAAGTP
jgi:hypothetical protein